MKRWLAVVALLAAGSVMAFDDNKEDGFVPLFNGKDLSGWEYKGSKESLAGKAVTADGRVAAQDGVIVMRPKDKAGKSSIKELRTRKEFGKAFHLKLEFKAAPKADSGVYVRGPQLQVRDFIRLNQQPGLRGTFKNDGWNALDIIVKNAAMTAIVNGKPVKSKDDLRIVFKGGEVASATLNGKSIEVKSVQLRKGSVAHCLCNGVAFETMANIPDKGKIGLQAETGQFEFRNIRIKELK